MFSIIKNLFATKPTHLYIYYADISNMDYNASLKHINNIKNLYVKLFKERNINSLITVIPLKGTNKLEIVCLK